MNFLLVMCASSLLELGDPARCLPEEGTTPMLEPMHFMLQLVTVLAHSPVAYEVTNGSGMMKGLETHGGVGPVEALAGQQPFLADVELDERDHYSKMRFLAENTEVAGFFDMENTVRSIAFAMFLSLPASNALAQDTEDELACRNAYNTANLLQVIIAQWGEWTVQSLVTFWPDPIEALGPGSTPSELPTMYGRFIGPYGRCGEVFSFTRAQRGAAQYLESVEIRYASDTFEDVELAGKAVLRSYGNPFDFLGDAYDEWRLDDAGVFRRRYRWDEPEIHVAIEIERRDDLYRLTMTYDRETWLDRSPPDTPEAPFKIAIATPDPQRFPSYQRPCLSSTVVTNDDLNTSARLANLLKIELSARETWFELVPESETDFLVIVGAHWDDAARCSGVVIPLPGLHLGLEFSEHGPDWRDLETLEKSAGKLAEGVEELFRDNYWRFRQFHP